MSALTVLLCFCMVSPLLSLKCHQSGPSIPESECFADTSLSQLCVTITQTMSDGSTQVVKDCQQSTTTGCVKLTFCNDRDFCNTNESDFTVAASVTSRSCKCAFPTGLLAKVIKPSLSNLSSLKDIPDCDSTGECSVTAGPSETAVCLSQTLPTFPGKIFKFCSSMKITGGTAFPSRQTRCSCNTNMCNSGGDPVLPTTPVVPATPTLDISTAAASVSIGSNTPSADVTATSTSSAALCDSSVFYFLVLAILGKIFV